MHKNPWINALNAHIKMTDDKWLYEDSTPIHGESLPKWQELKITLLQLFHPFVIYCTHDTRVGQFHPEGQIIIDKTF